MLGLLQAVTSALRSERTSECEILPRKTASYKPKLNKTKSEENRAYANLILTNCCSICYENCEQQGNQGITKSPSASMNNREFATMLAHCDNNNTVMTRCDNNNSSKKFKKEKRRSKKEPKSSCTCCGSEMENGKSKPKISTTERSSTDQPPPQPSTATVGVADMRSSALNRLSSNIPQQDTSANTTTTSTYYPPPVRKWPHSSVMENPISGRGADSTCCRPPPNRTILKNDGKIIISESEDKYVINDEAGSCRPVDEQTLTKLVRQRQGSGKLVRERQGSGKSKPLPPRPDKGAKSVQSATPTQAEGQRLSWNFNTGPPPSYHGDVPPEYSDPPDYFSVI